MHTHSGLISDLLITSTIKLELGYRKGATALKDPIQKPEVYNVVEAEVTAFEQGIKLEIDQYKLLAEQIRGDSMSQILRLLMMRVARGQWWDVKNK